MSWVTALVPAAGIGARMNLDLTKPLLEIKKKPIILYTLDVLQESSFVDEIVLIFHRDHVEDGRRLVKKYKLDKVSRVIEGGETRKQSVSHGLDVVGTKTDLVMIHDGVRPFVDEGSISRVVEEARLTGAAVLGVPVKSTIKRVDKRLDVDVTLKRDLLWEIQTPQVYARELIQKAYLRMNHHAVPDDAALVELMGKKVRVVMGSYFNIKITTQEDLVFAEAIASIRAME
jgi:2-C-methyl-D-erythritol 4-phosphate cytidylyltransferase